MTNLLSFDDLQGIMHRHIDPLPDHRKKGPNTSNSRPWHHCPIQTIESEPSAGDLTSIVR
jgi:hypothetical protein